MILLGASIINLSFTCKFRLDLLASAPDGWLVVRSLTHASTHTHSCNRMQGLLVILGSLFFYVCDHHSLPAHGADVLIHEATLENSLAELAAKKKHS